MPRRTDFSYTQLCIGIPCGHICEEWPVVSGIGGTDPTVLCVECTREQYGLSEPEATGLGVWVRFKEKAEPTSTGKKPAKKAAAPKKAKPKKPGIWDRFL